MKNKNQGEYDNADYLYKEMVFLILLKMFHYIYQQEQLLKKYIIQNVCFFVL